MQVHPTHFYILITFSILLLSGCSSVTQKKGLDFPICIFASQTRMSELPSNASNMRTVASKNSGDPNSFGPPPSQRDLPNSRWDKTNEYWYLTDSGDVYLYSNTDDSFVYYWHFRDASDGVQLLNNSLLDCDHK